MRFAWRWLPVVLLGGLVLAPDPVGAQQPREGLRKGMKDLTIAGGYTVSHDIPPGDNPTVRSVLLMPHVGYVLTDPIGPGLLKGNLELMGEPFVQVFTDPNDRVGGGLSALARWIFATETALLPYVEVGVGVMGNERLDVRQTDCRVNFVLEAGVGALYFLTEKVALTVGYRFHHLSNSNICDRNRGINSSLPNLGISYFFP